MIATFTIAQIAGWVIAACVLVIFGLIAIRSNSDL
jgi:hypothetical protein